MATREILERGRSERPRHRRRSIAALAPIIAGLMIGAPTTVAWAVEEPPAAPLTLEPMTDAEATSVGCAVAAAGVGVATIAAGGVALIAAGAGVGAGSTAVAVPVVVATMAGGCNLGAMATPAFQWLKRQGYTLGSGVVSLVPNPVK